MRHPLAMTLLNISHLLSDALDLAQMFPEEAQREAATLREVAAAGNRPRERLLAALGDTLLEFAVPALAAREALADLDSIVKTQRGAT